MDITMSMKRINISTASQSIIVKAEKLHHLIWFQMEGFIYSLPYRDSIIKESVNDNEKKIYNNRILSDIPGQVMKILVSVGQPVTENQALVVLSSMKMEYTLKASYGSRVKMIKIKEGEQVRSGQELIELEKK